MLVVVLPGLIAWLGKVRLFGKSAHCNAGSLAVRHDRLTSELVFYICGRSKSRAAQLAGLLQRSLAIRSISRPKPQGRLRYGPRNPL